MKELKPIALKLNERQDSLIAAFLASQDINKNSKNTYRLSLKRYIAWVVENEISSPTREDILAYKSYLEAQGLSSFTLASYLVAVRKFFEWTEGMKYYPNIAKGVKGSKGAKGFRKDPLTVNQIRELLGSININTLHGKRDYALLNLLIRTGLRTIEVVRTNREDMRQESGEAVLWIQGKGRDSKDEFVLLTEDTLKPIRRYLKTRGRISDKDPLFASLSDRNRNQRLTTYSISRLVKRRLRGVGLNDGRITAHSLRHTAITLSLLAGATIQEAQALGRHADINTTLIYAHNINRLSHAPERKIEAFLRET